MIRRHLQKKSLIALGALLSISCSLLPFESRALFVRENNHTASASSAENALAGGVSAAAESLKLDAEKGQRNGLAEEIPKNTFQYFGPVYVDALRELAPEIDSYPGVSPAKATADAFTDPVTSPDGAIDYFRGGGHGAGYWNGVAGVYKATGQVFVAVPATPLNKMPPSYRNHGRRTPGPLFYPSHDPSRMPKHLKLSGCRPTVPLPDDFMHAYPDSAPGHFSASLSHPEDKPYEAPFDAPVVTHEYQSGAYRVNPENGHHEIWWFYGDWIEAVDLTIKQWIVLPRDLKPVGQLLYDYYPQAGAHKFGPGTSTIYDEVHDRFYVAVVLGGCSSYNRNGIFEFDPIVKRFVDRIPGHTGRVGFTFIQAGRYGYILHNGSAWKKTYQGGGAWRFNLDSHKVERIRFNGELQERPWAGNQPAEAIVGMYDPKRNSIIRYDYAHEPDALYVTSLEKAPLSGTGSSRDPYVLDTVRVPIAGDVPRHVLNYRRMSYVSETGLLTWLPRADSRMVGVSLEVEVRDTKPAQAGKQ